MTVLVGVTLNLDHGKFGGHTLRGRRNTVLLICHVTLRAHVRRRPYDLMGGNSSPLVTTLSGLLVISLV